MTKDPPYATGAIAKRALQLKDGTYNAVVGFEAESQPYAQGPVAGGLGYEYIGTSPFYIQPLFIALIPER